MATARGGCSNTSTPKDCDVPQVWLDEAPLLPTDRDERAHRLPLPSVRGHLQPLPLHALREETLAPLAGSSALARGEQGGIEHERSAQELGVSRSTVHELRKELQQNARRLRPEAPLMDEHSETDEMFHNAGGKGYRHPDIPTTRPEDAPTRGEATATTTKMTVRR